MATYCEPADLLLGNIPLPSGVSKEQYINAATDEIDIHIGGLYKTPVIFGSPEDQKKYRATSLLLKQLCSHLATGRLIMAIDAAGEDTQLHAYGWSLVRGALAILRQISSQEIILEGAILADTNNTSERPKVIVTQLDNYSAVERFYDAGHGNINFGQLSMDRPYYFYR